jgi:hypothetical protein
MRSALYYPHTEIRSKNLLKTSLLLWDRLEFIVPFDGYRPRYDDREVSEAIELFGVQRTPTVQEKREVHTEIEDLVTRQLPQVFYYEEGGRFSYSDYEIYPQKLLPETWKMLQQQRLVTCH